MIFVDSSALVAMLVGESDGEELADRLEAARRGFVSPFVIYETALALIRLKRVSVVEAREVVASVLQQSDVVVIEIGRNSHLAALEAHERFGKGTGHPAQLNMGDCFSYAMAKELKVPLLYKGNDFAQTDLA